MAHNSTAPSAAAKTGDRLGGKDLINIGIFTAIYFVVVFAVACLGFIPILMAAICGIIPLIAGIPYMLFLTRARKFGMITILGLLTGIIMFITGMGYFSIATGLICGLIADLILRAGGYKSLKCSVASHCVFSLWVIGTMLPMWILGQAYFEPYRASQGDAFVNESLAYLSGGMLVIVVVGIIVCALIGAAIGTKVLRKHFERAGIA